MRGVQKRGAVLTALNPRGALTSALAVVVIAADQVTKTWAVDHLQPYGSVHYVFGSLSLILTLNSGAAFSLGRGVTPVLEVVAALLVVSLVVLSRRTRRAGWLFSVGTGLLLGGAVSNLGDRIFRHHGGAVIDFISMARVGDHNWWPIFNLADAAITVGAVVLVIAFSRARTPEQKRPVGAGGRPPQP